MQLLFIWFGRVEQCPKSICFAGTQLNESALGSVAQLSVGEALSGLVMPASAYVLIGPAGAVLVVIICFMAVTSSGASEMVAISSLFTFDVYRKYINPKASPVCKSGSKF